MREFTLFIVIFPPNPFGFTAKRTRKLPTGRQLSLFFSFFLHSHHRLLRLANEYLCHPYASCLTRPDRVVDLRANHRPYFFFSPFLLLLGISTNGDERRKTFSSFSGHWRNARDERLTTKRWREIMSIVLFFFTRGEGVLIERKGKSVSRGSLALSLRSGERNVVFFGHGRLGIILDAFLIRGVTFSSSSSGCSRRRKRRSNEVFCPTALIPTNISFCLFPQSLAALSSFSFARSRFPPGCCDGPHCTTSSTYIPQGRKRD